MTNPVFPYEKLHSHKGRQLTAFFQNSIFFNNYNNNKKIYLDLSSITLYEHQCYRPENRVRSGMEKITETCKTQLGGSDAALIVRSFQTLEFNWIQWCHISRAEDGAEVSAGRLLLKKQRCKCLGLRSCCKNCIRFGSATLNEKIGTTLGKQSFL